jgi:putative transposase
MPRIARVVVPGTPHHVTQRGVRRMPVFFSDDDRQAYIDFLAEQSRRFGIRYLAWCLMTNHIHLIAVPETEMSLARGIGEAHKRYSRMINFREGWRGYLFQGRFFSCPLEGGHVISAIRYVLRNPVRAGIVRNAWSYPWSSARWLVGRNHQDPLAEESPMLPEVGDWRTLLSSDPHDPEVLRRHTRTGRPLGSESFLEHVERLTGRSLRPRRPGRKRKRQSSGDTYLISCLRGVPSLPLVLSDHL